MHFQIRLLPLPVDLMVAGANAVNLIDDGPDALIENDPVMFPPKVVMIKTQEDTEVRFTLSRNCPSPPLSSSDATRFRLG